MCLGRCLIYLHLIRVPTGFGKVWKNMFPDFCRVVFFFFFIENSEFNKFIIQEVRFHGSCLVIR